MLVSFGCNCREGGGLIPCRGRGGNGAGRRLVSPEVEAEQGVGEGQVAVIQLVNVVADLRPVDAEGGEQAVVFHGREAVLGVDMVGVADGQLVFIFLQAEKELLACADVSDLQDVSLDGPIDVASRHVGCAFGGKGVNLAQLPVGIKLVVAGHFDVAGGEQGAGEQDMEEWVFHVAIVQI